MSDKKVYNSFEDLGAAFFKEHPEYEIQKALLVYGLDVSSEEAQYIEIIDSSKEKVIYKNTKTGEIVTSDLTGRIYDAYPYDSVSLTTSNQDGTFIVDQFTAIERPESFIQAGEKALVARANPNSRLISRAYADVSTKYGDFCLHIEENYLDYNFGPYRQVTVYFGNHNDVLDPISNKFDFSGKGFFRWKFLDYGRFSQWLMGYNKSIFQNPVRNVWCYEEPFTSKKCDSPIYSFTSRTENNNGVIFLDGSLKLKDNEKSLPEFFNYYSDIGETFLEYENLSCQSKAYFANPAERVAIIKQGNKIHVDFKSEDRVTREWDKEFLETINSETSERFTSDDFEKIIECVSNVTTFGIGNRLTSFILNELGTYKDIHKTDDFSMLDGFSLEDYDFSQMVDFIKSSDLTKVIEESLDTFAEKFHTSIDFLLGVDFSNKEKSPQYVNKPKND